MSHEQLSSSTFELPLASEYGALPKRFGEVHARALLSIAQRAENALEQPTELQHTSLQRINYHEIAGDGYLEGAITLTNETIDDVDFRLRLVDLALDHYRQSNSIRQERMLDGRDNPDAIGDLLRTQLRIGFEQTYKDIICQEVSKQTRQETKELLEYTHTYLDKARKNIQQGIKKGHYELYYQEYAKDISGLWGEIRYLQSIWNDTNRLPETVSFISMARADTGNMGLTGMLSRDTHDVVIAKKDLDTWTFVPVEIKRGNVSSKKNRRHLGRYSSQLVYVSSIGRTETLPHADMPASAI